MTCYCTKVCLTLPLSMELVGGAMTRHQLPKVLSVRTERLRMW